MVEYIDPDFNEIKGPDARFDVPADKPVRFRPTAFLGNVLSMTKAEFSAVQLGYYLRLILGLDFPPQQTSDGKYFCGRVTDSSLPSHKAECLHLLRSSIKLNVCK